MSTRDLLDQFDRWRAAGQDLVLVTVTGTQGSTYSKAGQRMLIAADGSYQGLVSGGCLEGDLAEHARAVLTERHPRELTYDLRGPGEELWGFGSGCEGSFRLLLQPLDPGYEPLASIAALMRGDQPGAAAILVSGPDGAPPPGTTVLAQATGTVDPPMSDPLTDPWRRALWHRARDQLGRQTTATGTLAVGSQQARVLVQPLLPLPRLLVVGAGTDVQPLALMGRQIGWRVTIADHRPAQLARLAALADTTHVVRSVEAAHWLTGRTFDAVVLMSHHLPTDRDWLAALATCPPKYLGLLGPRARGERLLAELGPVARGLVPLLRSPAGLSIGADSPATIALSILAEIQATIHARVMEPARTEASDA